MTWLAKLREFYTNEGWVRCLQCGYAWVGCDCGQRWEDTSPFARHQAEKEREYQQWLTRR